MLEGRNLQAYLLRSLGRNSARYSGGFEKRSTPTSALLPFSVYRSTYIYASIIHILTYFWETAYVDITV